MTQVVVCAGRYIFVFIHPPLYECIVDALIHIYL